MRPQAWFDPYPPNPTPGSTRTSQNKLREVKIRLYLALLKKTQKFPI